ncbi:hydroxyisourate hydrolase [Aureimonas frigidaquae]|uniref:hydroxyisourate hydrolase n=1 Tax=Aureimonas frigidaquae TaxID=424757 RepID=UPI000786072D|nr:hydroxyisourate hydrolase [Aureimonas frigidaquae]
MADAGAGSGRLTTHVLDTARGIPAAGLTITLYRLTDGGRELLASVVTNADGRVDGALLDGDAFAPGSYELVFQAGDYFDALGLPGGQPRFLDAVPVRFGMAEARHYHVPLLLSPYGYSTYRGS